MTKAARKKKSPKRKRGKQPHVPTAETSAQVKALVIFGLGARPIASFLGIAPNTLRRHYQKILERARLELYAHTASGLVKAIANGDDWAIRFVLRTQGRKYGWEENPPPDPNGAGAGVPIRLSSLSDAQLVQFLERLQAAAQNADAVAADTHNLKQIGP